MASSIFSFWAISLTFKKILSGTAAELTPLRSIDKIQIGKGRRGPITQQLQEEFFAIVRGTKPDRHNWLTPVPVPATTAAR